MAMENHHFRAGKTHELSMAIVNGYFDIARGYYGYELSMAGLLAIMKHCWTTVTAMNTTLQGDAGSRGSASGV